MLRVIRPLNAALRMRLWQRLKKSNQIPVVDIVTISLKWHMIPVGHSGPIKMAGLRHTLLGISQEQLGAELIAASQQVQK